jgi:hypothetical protein
MGGFVTGRKCACKVALQYRGEGLLGLLGRVVVGLGLNAVGDKQQLGVQRLLSPERAVVIEYGNTCAQLYMVGQGRAGHALDECDDGLATGGVLPGGEGRCVSLAGEADQYG